MLTTLETDQLLNKCKPEELTNSVSKQVLERHPVAQNCVCTHAHRNIHTSLFLASMSQEVRGCCNSTISLYQFTGYNRTIKCTESLPIFMIFVSLSMKYLLACPIDFNPKLSCIHGIIYKDFKTLFNN